MTCPNCFTLCPDGQTMCGECGRPLPQPTVTATATATYDTGTGHDWDCPCLACYFAATEGDIRNV